MNPADMTIEEIGGSFTVVGFYEETGQKYAGHHETETVEEAEAEATELGVSVCGVFAGSHNAVDQSQIVGEEFHDEIASAEAAAIEKYQS